jgi:mRNA-degrading endonuclease toxin of MazEF toxin-antitoxin module
VWALDTRQLLRRLGSVEDDTLARSLATLREMFAE